MGAHPYIELCINTLISVFLFLGKKKTTHTPTKTTVILQNPHFLAGELLLEYIFQREESDEISRRSVCHSSSLEF